MIILECDACGAQKKFPEKTSIDEEEFRDHFALVYTKDIMPLEKYLVCITCRGQYFKAIDENHKKIVIDLFRRHK